MSSKIFQLGSQSKVGSSIGEFWSKFFSDIPYYLSRRTYSRRNRLSKRSSFVWNQELSIRQYRVVRWVSVSLHRRRRLNGGYNLIFYGSRSLRLLLRTYIIRSSFPTNLLTQTLLNGQKRKGLGYQRVEDLFFETIVTNFWSFLSKIFHLCKQSGTQSSNSGLLSVIYNRLVNCKEGSH